MHKQVHIIVTGRVQGVFFRANTQRKAQELGVTGTVQNKSDGSVEITAQGESDALNKLIDFCRIGPTGSRVTSIKIIWEETPNKLNSFQITY